MIIWVKKLGDEIVKDLQLIPVPLVLLSSVALVLKDELHESRVSCERDSTERTGALKNNEEFYNYLNGSMHESAIYNTGYVRLVE